MKMRRCILCLLMLLSALARADERILEFRSDVLIRQSGWIQVTETIRVRAEGNRIRRGIYRDFPTDYRDAQGNNYRVEFRPLAVLRDGSPESFHTQDMQDYKRVYFGRSDRFIASGEHTYTFRYEANRLLGYFDDHDELYWNATGNEWAFPIDRASATAQFEFNVAAADIGREAYTGPLGAAGHDYISRVGSDSRVYFETTAPLPPASGLTIVVTWPKGFVVEPTRAARLGWLLRDNANLITAVVGLALLLAYYIPVWSRFGRDPEPGVLVTRYEPPQGFSPASLRYIRQMYYDDKVMTAAVVNLAVKGYLRIEVEEGSKGFLGIGATEDKYTLVRSEPAPGAPPLAAGERELRDALFAEGSSVLLDQENHKLLGKARAAHARSLSRDYNQQYFRWNGLLNVPAVLILLLTMAIALSLHVSALVIVVGVLMLVTTIAFSIIMKAPTLRGRKVLDEVLGFKDYLEIAEKDEMNLRNPPKKTPELFEAYLPFALALGVDQRWSEKFAALLATARQPGGAEYRPAWYGGTWNSSHFASSTSRLGSALNTAISTSVSPPGSGSGSGGGGFSGGGGGGGGGGGW